MFLKPRIVESELGITTKTLQEKKDTIFIRGVHYFIPDGLSYPLWDRDALIEWVKRDGIDKRADLMADKILNNN